MVASYKTELLPNTSYKQGGKTVIMTAASQAKAKASMLNAANNTFASEIAKAEELVGLDKTFFLPFGQHETEWRNVQNSAGTSASGPMQIMPASAVGAICASSSFLNKATRDELIRLLGKTRANGYLKPGMGGTKAIKTYGKITVQELLQKPDLSVLCAVILLGYLARANTKNGQVDLIRLLAQYSQGNAPLVANSPKAQLLEIKARYSTQTYNYVISMVGKYGLMSAF